MRLENGGANCCRTPSERPARSITARPVSRGRHGSGERAGRRPASRSTRTSAGSRPVGPATRGISGDPAGQHPGRDGQHLLRPVASAGRSGASGGAGAARAPRRRTRAGSTGDAVVLVDFSAVVADSSAWPVRADRGRRVRAAVPDDRLRARAAEGAADEHGLARARRSGRWCGCSRTATSRPSASPRPAAIETWVPVIVFAFAFGVSMDYEVFLLARIKEQSTPARAATPRSGVGLQRTGRIITSAALLIVIVFGGFAAGRMLGIEEIGLRADGRRRDRRDAGALPAGARHDDAAGRPELVGARAAAAGARAARDVGGARAGAAAARSSRRGAPTPSPSRSGRTARPRSAPSPPPPTSHCGAGGGPGVRGGGRCRRGG